jgi:hypothetical protein
MNYISLIFAGVLLFVVLFFGISASQSIIDSTNITAEDTYSDNFNTTVDVSQQTFTVMSYIPYLLFVIALLSVILLMTKLI